MGWIKAIPPKLINDNLGVYSNSIWFKEMDRCWIREEDGIMVSSRLIRVPEEFGSKVEHVTITRSHRYTGKLFTCNGEGDLSWQEKQTIKNELFGESRLAIEIFPKTSKLIDTADVYHLWVFDKKFDMPFGIHPKEYSKSVNRGCSFTESDGKILKTYYESF